MESLGTATILEEGTPVYWEKLSFDQEQNKIIIPCSRKNLGKIQVMAFRKRNFVIEIKSLKEFKNKKLATKDTIILQT